MPFWSGRRGDHQGQLLGLFTDLLLILALDHDPNDGLRAGRPQHDPAAAGQGLLDLLKEPGNFFPFRSESGAFCAANKQTVTHIRFDPPEEGKAYQSLGDREDVEIKFVGGEQLSGTVTIEMPEGRKRLFDFINATKSFFELHNQEAHYLVNVTQVRDISPL